MFKESTVLKRETVLTFPDNLLAVLLSRCCKMQGGVRSTSGIQHLNRGIALLGTELGLSEFFAAAYFPKNGCFNCRAAGGPVAGALWGLHVHRVARSVLA